MAPWRCSPRTQLCVWRLSWRQALQLELVHEHFGGGGGPVDALHPLSSLKDDAVKEYLRTVMQKYGDTGPVFLASAGPEAALGGGSAGAGDASPAAGPASTGVGGAKVRG